FWQFGATTADIGPPPEGFFRIWQDAPASPPPIVLPAGPNMRWDGLPDQISEYRNVRAALHFSVRLTGNGSGDVFATELPTTNPQNTLWTLGRPDGYEQRFQDGGPIFRTPWAEG